MVPAPLESHAVLLLCFRCCVIVQCVWRYHSSVMEMFCNTHITAASSCRVDHTVWAGLWTEGLDVVVCFQEAGPLHPAAHPFIRHPLHRVRFFPRRRQQEGETGLRIGPWLFPGNLNTLRSFFCYVLYCATFKKQIETLYNL